MTVSVKPGAAQGSGETTEVAFPPVSSGGLSTESGVGISVNGHSADSVTVGEQTSLLTLSTHLIAYIGIHCRQPRALSSVAWGHLNLA